MSCFFMFKFCFKFDDKLFNHVRAADRLLHGERRESVVELGGVFKVSDNGQRIGTGEHIYESQE